MIIEEGRTRSLQSILSVIILSALTVIGTVIFLIQFQYNPAVLQKNAFLQETSGEKLAAASKPTEFFEPLPEGVATLTPAETFDTQTLSDKINGKAELYLSAGFKRLVSQRFKKDPKSDAWMEAYVYHMGNSQNAFSVFSTQRRNDAASLDLTQNAYRTSNALFFTHGPYYVEIIASKPFEKLPAFVKKMAETLIQNNPLDTTAKTDDISALFPKKALISESISLISANAFGYEGFDKIYTAEYEIEGRTLMAYLSRRKSPEAARKLASSYAAFLLAFGGRKIEKDLPVKDAQIIEVLDTYEMIFVRGPFLAGIRESASLEAAEVLAGRLYDRLKE